MAPHLLLDRGVDAIPLPRRHGLGRVVDGRILEHHGPLNSVWYVKLKFGKCLGRHVGVPWGTWV